ncbi:hypothetical protein L915_07014 [Phytophthora nicotianae]|uniref:Uncharacterized protein n=1 Tax=Phytophthora nicotianae TaxID=4792 RepID=W2H0H3_PHYNI|nr:hypothetical protein L915_07014 [Phytophthora nicotianae]
MPLLSDILDGLFDDHGAVIDTDYIGTEKECRVPATSRNEKKSEETSLREDKQAAIFDRSPTSTESGVKGTEDTSTTAECPT